MFAKLLKHEWKSSSGILGILSLAALGVGVLGGVILRIITGMEMRQDAELALEVVLSMTMMLLILSLIAYAAAVEIILLYRFYKRKFTDEGYLTFTLPVSSHQIFLSSFLNIAAWMIISILVVLVSLSIMFLFGIDWSRASTVMGNPSDFWEVYTDVYGNELTAWNIILGLISSLMSFLSGIVTPMCCLTIGSVVAKKHKILMAFAIGYGVSMVSGMVSGVLSAVSMLSAESYSMTSMYLVEIGTQLILMVGGYFLSTYLMQKKLNLP